MKKYNERMKRRKYKREIENRENEYRNSYTIVQNSNTNTKYIYQTIRERGKN